MANNAASRRETPSNPHIPSSAKDEWQGDKVYFGKWKGKPLQWKVLQVSNGSMVLMTDCAVNNFIAYQDVNQFFAGSDSLDGTTAREYPRKGKVNKKLHMEWVPEIDHRGYSLTLLAMEIEETEEKSGKTKTLTFQRLTDLSVTIKNAGESANAGRGRWCIEIQGFNIQKNIRYDIQHADSLDYNAMKCRYLLTQIADILLQLYEKGRPGIRKAQGTIKNISSSLLKSFGQLLAGEDISFIAAYGYVKAA